MLRGMTIKIQLLLGFGTCMLLLVILAVISISRVNDVNTNLATMNDVNSVKQRYAINFRGSVHDRAIALRDVVLVEPAPAREEVLATIAALTAKYAASAGPLDTMLTADRNPTPEEIQILAGIKEVEQKTLPLIRNTIARRQAGDLAGANSLLMMQARPLFVEWLARINRFIDLQESMNKTLAQTTRETTSSFQWLLLCFCIGGVAVGSLVAFWAMRSVRQLPEMANVMERLSQDARSVDIPPGSGEIGDLARAMVRFRDQLVTAEDAKDVQATLLCGSIGAGLDALSKGDLTHRIDADLTGPFAKLKTDFNAAMDSVGGTLVAVNRSTANIRTGSHEISQASDDLSRRTEQQAASLEETAAAMDEITATVRETASGAVRANQVVAETRTDAEEGGRVVREAVTAMGGIERASNEISEIISVIDGIAFQTNLLALNAGVEAARAGDAGRGFAVVASEVRALAQRSAEAAKDVKTKIMASTGQVETGVTLVGETGRALERIVGRIGEISQLVSAIAQSAEQQAAGLQQVNTAVGEMDSVTQQNAAMVEESTAAARSLAAEAEDLARHVARFRMGEDHGYAAAPDRSTPRAPAPAPRKIVAARRPAAAAPQTHGALALKLEPDADDWSRF